MLEPVTPMPAPQSHPFRARLLPSALAALGLSLAGCSTLGSIQDTFLGGGVNAAGGAKRITGFIGGVVADEPTAALAGREVLALGGTAADAAVAVGFTLAVTYPSRASLGAGGGCLVYSPAKTSPGAGAPEAIVFVAAAAGPVGGRTDRPAAIPMLARGLYALHARYGRRPFETLVAPAEQLARFGTPASRAFVRDLALVSGPLLADPNARAIFAPSGQPLTEGVTMVQSDLGGTLAQLRVAGVGDLYQGNLAERFVRAAEQAGGGVSASVLRAALPKTLPPLTLPAGRDMVAFLPPPIDGGLATDAAFRVLWADPAATGAATARAAATAAAFRQGGVTADALLANPPASGSLPPLPASTTFAALDRDGGAVVCAVTMNNLFGTGRVAPGTGIVLGAAPSAASAPLLAAGLVWNTSLEAFRAMAGGSGQNEAATAAAAALAGTLRTNEPTPVPEPGRANVIACARYLPDSEGSCRWTADPRGDGLAAGSS